MAMSAAVQAHDQCTYTGRPEVAIAAVEPTLNGWAHEVVPSSASTGAIYLGPKQAFVAPERAAPPNLFQAATLSAGETAEEQHGEILAGLRSHRIRGIVNCTPSMGCSFQAESDMQYARVPVHDESAANILRHLRDSTMFMHFVLSRGDSVGVHCQMGASRSASVVISYLMQYRGMTRDAAFSAIKSRRPQVNPNPGFWDQLAAWERECESRRRQGEGGGGGASAMRAIPDTAPPAEPTETWAAAACGTFMALGDVLGEAVCVQGVVKATELPGAGGGGEGTTCQGDGEGPDGGGGDRGGAGGGAATDIAFAAAVVDAALDYTYGVGATAPAVRWLGVLCRELPATAGAAARVRGHLRADSEFFADKWCGEFRAADVGRVLAAL